MPVELLSESERAKLSRFPEEIPPEDLQRHFTLSDEDIRVVEKRRLDSNRLGFSLALSALRYLGFFPPDLSKAPEEAVRYVADQIDADPDLLKEYGARPKTQREHQVRAMEHLSFRRLEAEEDQKRIQTWLVERALEHDRPSLLIEAVCEKLRRERFLRPGITTIERMVAAARQEAHEESLRRLSPLLTPERKALLDSLLVPEVPGERTPLGWLRRHATANSPRALLEVLDKLRRLQDWNVPDWDLTALNPNRRKMLARLGRKYSNQALQRMGPERRYPILLAFLKRTFTDALDEAADIFEECMAGAHKRSKRDLREHNQAIADATQEKVRLFHRVGQLVLDDSIGNRELRQEIFRRISPLELAAAVDEAEKIMRPEGVGYFDFLERRFSYVRQFAPDFLVVMPLKATRGGTAVMKGIEVLREMNAHRKRKVPSSAPTSFVPNRWRPFVFSGTNGAVDRHGWELCLLSELRGRLRSGDVHLEHSRRHADPESYLISEAEWPMLKDEVCQQLGLTPSGKKRLTERAGELKRLLRHLDRLLSPSGSASEPDIGEVRLDQGELIVPSLDAAGEPTGTDDLRESIEARLPRLDITSLLIETDAQVDFTRYFTHPSGNRPKADDHMQHLYASILAQGCNMSLADMAQSSGLSYDRLRWTTQWYVREDALNAATGDLVDFQHAQPLAKRWGGGTLSSSDGQRFPVRGKVRNAKALPRYFGYGRGITFYTWTSDQYSQFGTKVISTTVRDATYVLDEILDNETELTIREHTTDTDGYTDLVFGLFDLLGMRFSPRIRDLGAARLYRLRDDFERYPRLEDRLTGQVDLSVLEEGWDELLRVAGSLKMGYVTASLLISKLQEYPRQNRLTRLLKEHGRLAKTIHALRYLESEAYRRRIGRQLNKGERLHDLRGWLMFGGDGKIRRKQEEAQTCQAGCLNLMTNAVVVWNTLYMQEAVRQMALEGNPEGDPFDDQRLKHLSPARFEHVNRYGRYRFDVEREAGRTGLRPLREG
jgi:TnpA family transposase